MKQFSENHLRNCFQKASKLNLRLNTFREQQMGRYFPNSHPLHIYRSIIIDSSTSVERKRNSKVLPFLWLCPALFHSYLVPEGKFNYQVLLLLKGETILSKHKEFFIVKDTSNFLFKENIDLALFVHKNQLIYNSIFGNCHAFDATDEGGRYFRKWNFGIDSTYWMLMFPVPDGHCSKHFFTIYSPCFPRLLRKGK